MTKFKLQQNLVHGERLVHTNSVVYVELLLGYFDQYSTRECAFFFSFYFIFFMNEYFISKTNSVGRPIPINIPLTSPVMLSTDLHQNK
jgi:hypothetical protein